MKDINIPPSINLVIQHGLGSYKFNDSLSVNYIKVFKEHSNYNDYSFKNIRIDSIKAANIIKKELESLGNYEILAFDIPLIHGSDPINFFIKLTEEENKFIVLRFEFNFSMDRRLFISEAVNLMEFRYYGYFAPFGIYMKDELTKYDFELLSEDEYFTNILHRSCNKKELDIVNYFVIKNSLGDPIIMTRLLGSNDNETFNKILTKANPQAGLLFSLYYNANK